MPTYDYLCDACGHKFEEFQMMSEALLTKCPECKKKKLRRLIGSGSSIIFKGSGFYETDYRSEAYKNAAKADAAKSTPATESAKGDAAKSDTGKADTGKADTGKTTDSTSTTGSSEKPASKPSGKKKKS